MILPARLACPLLVMALAALAAGQQRPGVLRFEPAHLSTGLAASRTTQLKVTFDQDMDPTRQAVGGGGASLPRILRTQWLDARTFVLEVELAPDRLYSLDLAGSGADGLRAKTGIQLRPTPWRLASRGQPLPEGAAKLTAERLFTAVRDHYSYRDRIGVDWNELEHRSLESLATATDGPSLALWVTEVLTTAQDPHITVRWQECVVPTYRRPVVGNFDLAGLQTVLPRLERVGNSGLVGRTDDGIGYLLVASFAREHRDDLDRALQALRGLRDCKALVLDVRTNTGGDEVLARRLAGFFVQGEVVYGKHRTRDPKETDGFRVVESRSLRGHDAPDVFGKPVAVLMGQLNMSSCEAFLLMMKQAPLAVLVGADSYGSSGNPQPHTLLPGLVVQLPSWQALRPDGSLIEGEGISPHLYVDTTPAQLADGDPVLEAALSRLRRQR